MKIGIVCYPTFGGSGVVATELGKALANKGHQVHFITYRQPARLDFFSENLFYHEVNVSQYPLFEHAPYESALASTMVDVTLYERLDLLHVHYAIPHASAALMAKQILMTYGYCIPVITTLHGTDITLVGTDITYKPVVEYSINQSEGVTAVSQYLKEVTHKNFDIKREIEVIPNFVDLSRFVAKTRDHFKKAIAPLGERIVVHTSNFREVKRTLDVIRFFEKLIAATPVKLLMVGDGPERPACEQLARELKVCEHVRFLGKQDAVEEILSISDLFVMPSESESFGLAALEAMACGVPVISSNVGGIPEINVNGKTGFMSDLGDIDDMVNNAKKILQTPEKLSEFKANALARAKEFSIENILPFYENYYNQTIEQYCRKSKK